MDVNAWRRVRAVKSLYNWSAVVGIAAAAVAADDVLVVVGDVPVTVAVPAGVAVVDAKHLVAAVAEPYATAVAWARI